MQRSAVQHICITGACGAGKSTLAKALSRQLQLPVHRLDDDPDFRLLVEHELPERYRWTEPQRYARFHALRWQLVQEAVLLTQPHIIEGTHILAVTDCNRNEPGLQSGRFPTTFCASLALLKTTFCAPEPAIIRLGLQSIAPSTLSAPERAQHGRPSHPPPAPVLVRSTRMTQEE